jgi:hypothetical protein
VLASEQQLNRFVDSEGLGGEMWQGKQTHITQKETTNQMSHSEIVSSNILQRKLLRI